MNQSRAVPDAIPVVSLREAPCQAYRIKQPYVPKPTNGAKCLVGAWYALRRLFGLRCCLPEEEHFESILERAVRLDKFRREVKKEMCMSYDSYAGCSLEAVIHDIKASLNVDVTTERGTVFPEPGIYCDITEREDVTELLVDVVGEGPNIQQRLQQRIDSNTKQVVRVNYEVVRIPKLVAGFVLVLRSKLGKMRRTRANEMVAERELLKVAKSRSIRTVWLNAHYEDIIECFFSPDYQEADTTSHRRLAVWIKRYLGIMEPTPYEASVL